MTQSEYDELLEKIFEFIARENSELSDKERLMLYLKIAKEAEERADVIQENL